MRTIAGEACMRPGDVLGGAVVYDSSFGLIWNGGGKRLSISKVL